MATVTFHLEETKYPGYDLQIKCVHTKSKWHSLLICFEFSALIILVIIIIIIIIIIIVLKVNNKINCAHHSAC